MAKNELNTIPNELKEYIKSMQAENLFRRFMDRVEKGKVKNDGTDELLKIIDEHVIEDPHHIFRKTIKQGQIFYRARVIDFKDINVKNGFHTENGKLYGYGEADSREAPLGLSGEGRNNIKGVSYLYVANKPETACAEVKPRIQQYISLATFECVNALHIFDFSTKKKFETDDQTISLSELFTDIMYLYSQPVSNSNEYKATQLLADYLRRTGIDGISYNSYFDMDGVNYTIFNSDHRKIKFIDSRLLLFQNERQTFLDFNNDRVISAVSLGKAKFDEVDAFHKRQDIIRILSDFETESTNE